MIGEIDRHIGGFKAAEVIRDGFEVVILGAPNAGKSSLFNALAKREAAIVTDEPGTTRDLLEVVMDLNGLKVRIVDTAGLRAAAGKVESIGIERARAKAGEADLVLLLEDMAEPLPVGDVPSGAPRLKIGTKADIAAARAGGGYDLVISSTDGRGLGALLEAIGKRAAETAGDVGEILPSRLRHVELLQETMGFLEAALSGKSHELSAEELRLAADRLGRIVGTVDVEDLLDVIFSQFCIGK
jgi:tRNA modification GTPase